MVPLASLFICQCQLVTGRPIVAFLLGVLLVMNSGMTSARASIAPAATEVAEAGTWQPGYAAYGRVIAWREAALSAPG